MGTEAIKLLVGIGDSLLGRLMIYDALEMEYRKLKVRKDPNCVLCGETPTVTGLIDYDAFCGAISEEAAGLVELSHAATVSITAPSAVGTFTLAPPSASSSVIGRRTGPKLTSTVCALVAELMLVSGAMPTSKPRPRCSCNCS